MSIVIRSDGTQFALQASRKLLCANKKTQLVRQEIRLLAEQYGQYVRLFKKGQGRCEVVFSTEPGCLLGERIWQFFNEPDNLIYCEALPDSAQMLLVVVQQGSVQIDAQILASSLQSELLPRMTGDLSYRIITSGNVPLRKGESFGTFRFPKELIQSFETLKDPLFPRLSALKSLQLQPLPIALRSGCLHGGASTWGMLAFVLALMAGGWWLLTPEKARTPLQQPVLNHLASPYAAYLHALTTPAPDQQLLEIVHAINALYFLSGWQVSTLRFHQQTYRIDLTAEGGGMRFLRQWAQAHHYQFHLSARGAALSFRSAVPERPKPRLIYPSGQVVTQLVDQLNPLLQHQAVRLGATRRRGDVQETHLTVHLEAVSPNVLDLVSRQLNGMPVALTSVSLSLHSGLMSGIIKLSVWGK